MLFSDIIDKFEELQSLFKNKSQKLSDIIGFAIKYMKNVLKGNIFFEDLDQNLLKFIDFIDNENLLDQKIKNLEFSNSQAFQLQQIAGFFVEDTHPIVEDLDEISIKEEKYSPDEVASDENIDSSFIMFEGDDKKFEQEEEPLPDKNIFQDFITEANEHLSDIEERILLMESESFDIDNINAVFRTFHTIKGISVFLKLNQITQLTHKTESLIDKIVKKEISVYSGLVNFLLSVTDKLSEMIYDLSENIANDILKENEYDIENLLSNLDLVLENKSNFKDALTLNVIKSETEIKKKQLSEKSTIRVDANKVDNLIDYTGELLITQSILWDNPLIANNDDESFINNIDQIKQITSLIQKISLSMRMVPIKNIFYKMKRIIHDISIELDKKTSIFIEGEETELDRALIDIIHDPLVHIVRNSVDHGLENDSERLKAGKNPSGKITLRAFQQGVYIIIEISDDGGGINKETVLKNAIKNGVVVPETKLSNDQILQLIFKPGLTTANKITSLSGRGVGMDVVKKSLDKLNGKIKVTSEQNIGTTISMSIPLTLSIIHGLVVKISSEFFILPVLPVISIFRPEPDTIHNLNESSQVVIIHDETIPIISVGEELFINNFEKDPCQAILIIIENEGVKKALLVDEISGKKEVIIRSINSKFNRKKYFSGSAILGDGSVRLILNAINFF